MIQFLNLFIAKYVYSRIRYNNLRIMASKKNTKSNEPSQEDKRQAELTEFEKSSQKHLKVEIFRLREQLKDIVEKKRALETEIQSFREQNVKKTHKIDGSLKMEEQDLIEIETKFEQQQKKYKDQLRQLSHKSAIEEQAIRSRYKKEMELKKQQLNKISEKVEHLHHYPQRKIKYQSSLYQLNLRLDKMKNQQEKDLKNIKNNHLKERVLQQKQTEQEMEKIKVSEVNRLEKKMTKQQFIKRENQVMQQQIKLCEEQIILLTKQCQQLKTETKAEKMQIQDNTLGGQASETYERSLRIIKLEGKMNKLKAYLGEESSKLEKQFNELDHIYTKQHQETESKISKIQGWLRIKQRDLKKVKACSQMVLNQRSSLQSYLLEVFYEHPEIDYKNPFNMNKILRFLFVKINSKKPPMSYKNFLPVTSKTITENSFRA